MKIAAAVIAACTVAASALPAQTTDTVPSSAPARWELSLPTGTLIPTGELRGVVKRGNLSGLQVTYVARRALAIGAMVGWARSRDIGTTGDPKLDVFTYDVGAEARAPRLFRGAAVSVMPFAGLGAGGRSYDHRSLRADATHNLAAYGSAGAELAYRRVRVRLEARDYLSGFKPLVGGGRSTTRNDVVVLAGLRIVSR